MELANQIRQHRIECGLSQDELAKIIFVSRQTISNWETGKNLPDVQSLVLLGDVFDIPADELIQGDAALMRREMERDSVKMIWLAWLMVGALVLAIVFLTALSFAWRDPSGIGHLSKGNIAGVGVFLPLYIVALTAAIAVERIKMRNDIVSYREVQAFMNGKVGSSITRDSLVFSRSHPVATTFIKFAFAAAIGAVVGMLIFKLFG